MSNLLNAILNVNAALAYALVGILVFAEDAIFVGFVLPGETAAVLGGVVASRGNAQLWVMIPLVILAAILGDSVGYEVGKHFGTRLLDSRLLAKRRTKLDRARDFLRRRGGAAVFLGRFIAFFRAVMPALAGTSRMPYRRFLTFNAAGGIVWGTAYVLLGFLAGQSYAAVAKTVGQDSAIVIGGIVLIVVIVWRIRRRLRGKKPTVDGAIDEGASKEQPT